MSFNRSEQKYLQQRHHSRGATFHSRKALELSIFLARRTALTFIYSIIRWNILKGIHSFLVYLLSYDFSPYPLSGSFENSSRLGVIYSSLHKRSFILAP